MIRAHNGRRSVVAYNIQLVTDYNQVTYHFLKVMHVHAIMAKKNGVQPQASSSSNLVHAAVPQGNSLLAESAANNDGISDPVQLSVLNVFQSESKYVDDTGYALPLFVLALFTAPCFVSPEFIQWTCVECLCLQPGYQNYRSETYRATKCG